MLLISHGVDLKPRFLKLFGRGQGWTIHTGLGMAELNASREKYSSGWYQR
jgi:hypothetical protein